MNMKSSNVHMHTRPRWVVTAPRPKPIYGLERGTVQIHEPAAIVAARIDDCLRLRSVEAKFDSDRAEAYCKTSGMVQYQIYLYAGDSNSDNSSGRAFGSGEGSSSTFVEIVKSAGDGFLFINERNAIIDAAKGLGGVSVRDSNKSSTNNNNNKMMMVIPDELLDQYVPPSDTEIEDMLNKISDQLHSKYDNAVIFALQNLQSIMTPDKNYPNNPNTTSAANRVSKYIIGNYNCIRDMIASLFAARSGNIKDNERNEQICNLSLGILIHGMQMQTLFSDGGGTTTRTTQDYECEQLVQMMVPSLEATVANYDNYAHTACLAMKCLCLMVTSSSFARAMVSQTNIAKDVEEAKLYGSMEHLKLEQEAFTLQSKLVHAAA